MGQAFEMYAIRLRRHDSTCRPNAGGHERRSSITLRIGALSSTAMDYAGKSIVDRMSRAALARQSGPNSP